MKRFGRALLGIPLGIISGLLILSLINFTFSGVCEPLGVSDLIYQAQNCSEFIDRMFAYAILFSLFVIPLVVALKLGWHEDHIAKQLFFPLLFGTLAAVVSFIVAFILMVLEAVIDEMFGPDSLLGMGILIALFVGFCSTSTIITIKIID